MALLPVDDLRGPIYSTSLRPLACQVDFDLLTPGLTPMRCATAQAAVTIQVVTDIHVR
jgi:hypothetical protein